MKPIYRILDDMGISRIEDLEYIKKNLYFSDVDKTYYVIYRSKEPGFFTEEAQSLLKFFSTGTTSGRKIIFLFFCSGVTADFQVYSGTIQETHNDLIKLKSKEIIEKYYKRTPFKYTISNNDSVIKITK